MCIEHMVGMKGICDNNDAMYLVDDMGLSIKIAAGTSDIRYQNGKELFERKRKQAWQSVLQDVEFRGFKNDQILKSFKIEASETEEVTGGTKNIVFEISDNCELSGIFISYLLIDSVSEGQTTITINGDSYTINVVAGINKLNVNTLYSDLITISSDLDNITVNSGKGIVTFNGSTNCAQSIGETYGLTIVGDKRCDISQYLCRFPDKVGKALLYKTAALMYKELMLTTALSEILFVKDKSTIMTELASLDSDENLYQFEDKIAVSDTIKVARGKYQKQIDYLNRVLPKPKCGCCLQAVKSQYLISIP